MPCLQKYRWVKLVRACEIPGKGILGAWARLAMHAAFRYGVAVSGGQSDVIRRGYWTGKMAELMRILDCRWGSVLPTLEKLSEYGYMSGISAPIRTEWTGILPCFRSDWWSRASLRGVLWAEWYWTRSSAVVRPERLPNGSDGSISAST